MIVETSELPRLAGQVTMVSGGFDPLHPGHVAYFRAAAQLGLPVLCNVSHDGFVSQKHAPLLVARERAQIIDALGTITYTHVAEDETVDVLRRLRPALYVKGDDWAGRLPAAEVEACAQVGADIVFVDTVTHSSSALLKRHSAAELERMAEEFGAALAAQHPVTPDHYDTAYFAEDWRTEGNRYDLETRRAVEARNPRLIQEVFAPESVLDAGCGPGFLMLFLQELGIDVHGIDFAPASRELAPPRVADRIVIGDVGEAHFPDAAFDLVVCREVLEHLSVLQVRRTVAQLCRCSSRYVYVTARFHPEPAHLLDLTTDFETDPTHITLMTKALLRTLFALEGFVQRADLEQRMDWAGKDRVLVYERPSA